MIHCEWPPVFVKIGSVIPIGSLVAGRFCPVEVNEGYVVWTALTGILFGRWGYLIVEWDISPAANFTVAEGRGFGIADSISSLSPRNYF